MFSNLPLDNAQYIGFFCILLNSSSSVVYVLSTGIVCCQNQAADHKGFWLFIQYAVSSNIRSSFSASEKLPNRMPIVLGIAFWVCV